MVAFGQGSKYNCPAGFLEAQYFRDLQAVAYERIQNIAKHLRSSILRR